MILDLIARRTLLTAGAVGLGAALAVYAGNDWFHASLLPAVGLSNALGDALGSLFIVMAAFLCQRLVKVGLSQISPRRIAWIARSSSAGAASFSR